MKTLRSIICIGIGVLLSTLSVHATPYASGLINNGDGTMSFYLNESGGNVTITYEDGSINANFNGTTTGINLPSGIQTFTLGAHTSYTISVFKTGSGGPNLINTSPGFTPRGVAVNTRPASPYFGTVYVAAHDGGLLSMPADLSAFNNGGVQAAGVSWAGGGQSPYRLSITPDDYVMAGDISSANAGVFRIDPTLSTSQVFLGPVGEGTAGVGNGVFGTIQSRPLIIGNPSTGPVTLMDVDGDLQGPAGAFNCLMIYDNITLASLPYQTAPSVLGPEIGVNDDSETLGDNEYPGLTQGANGMIYASTYRNDFENPNLQIYDSTGQNQLWNSHYNGGTADYFLTTGGDGDTQGLIDSTVTLDQQYVVGLTIENWLVICPLVNGIPNVAGIVLSTPTGYTGNARGIAVDVADNIYLSSSGLGQVQSWSLGLTFIANTKGNASGSTSFALIPPYAEFNVAATTPLGSQAGGSFHYATAQPAVFTISLDAAQSGPLTIYFTLGGTATNTVNYTATTTAGTLALAASNFVTFPTGATSETVTITPTANPAAGPTLSVILNLLPTNAYALISPTTATAAIANTGPQTLSITATGAASMYRGLPNDFVSFVVTRWGDTNAGAWTLPYSAFSPGGTAVYGTDYTGGPQPVSYSTVAAVGNSGSSITIQPGNTTKMVELGLPQSHATFTGNKTITLSGTSGTSVEGTNYSFVASTVTAMLLDNLNPPETPLWSDPLTSTADQANWNVTYSQNGANIQYLFKNYNGIPTQDFDANFGYNPQPPPQAGYDYDFVPYPPNGGPGVLRVTADKLTSDTPEAAGVNLYPNNAPVFSGNYALRFSMNLVHGCDAGFATDFAMFGINHYGTNVNWWLGSTDAGGFSFTNADGIWFIIAADVGQSGNVGAYPSDFMIMTATNGNAPNDYFPSTGYWPLNGASYTSYTNVFKGPLDYNASLGAGVAYDIGTPANLSGWAADSYSSGSCTPPGTDFVGPWVDVEVKQFNNVITMSLNKTAIFVYTNVTPFTSGFPMLGYARPFTTQGAGGGAYFSNIRVVSLAGPTITGVNVSGGNVVITFTSPHADAVPSSFSVYSSRAVGSGYAAISATITQSGDVFTAVTPYSSFAAQFFLISETNVVQ